MELRHLAHLCNEANSRDAFSKIEYLELNWKILDFKVK
jgi:hypothetical protein